MSSPSALQPLGLEEYESSEFLLGNRDNASRQPGANDAGSTDYANGLDPDMTVPTQIAEDLGVQDLGVDDVVTARSIRRPLPKLDSDRLLGARGYPALLRNLKKVRYRGKGDEKRFLRKYVMTYQIWANRLWPKANFDDFIALARRAGKDPRVREYCRDLIEEEKYAKNPHRGDAIAVATGDVDDAQPRSQISEPLDAYSVFHPSSDPVGHDADESHTDAIDDNEHGNIPSAGGERSGVPEFDPRADFEQQGSTSPDGSARNNESQGDRAPDGAPDDDEMEAAMELYGDMGF